MQAKLGRGRDRLAAEYPGMRFVEVASQVEPSENSYNASMAMLLEGALLAVVVVWFFLRDWRATWICAVALPLSVIPTFAVMYWMGFSLNLLSLLAFAVVIGILVTLICYGAILMKGKLGYDDSLDVFGVHGVGGAFGAVAVGLLATTAMTSAAGINGGKGVGGLVE